MCTKIISVVTFADYQIRSQLAVKFASVLIPCHFLMPHCPVAAANKFKFPTQTYSIRLYVAL